MPIKGQGIHFWGLSKTFMNFSSATINLWELVKKAANLNGDRLKTDCGQSGLEIGLGLMQSTTQLQNVIDNTVTTVLPRHTYIHTYMFICTKSMQNVSRITANMQDRKVMQDSYNCPKSLN